MGYLWFHPLMIYFLIFNHSKKLKLIYSINIKLHLLQGVFSLVYYCTAVVNK